MNPIFKIAVASVGGGVGKTAMSKNLFVPNLPGAKRLEVENMNSGDGAADASIKSKQFKELASELFVMPSSFVLDIGANTLESIAKDLEYLDDLVQAIDLWVIPTTPIGRLQADAGKTAKLLVKTLGVDPSKIFILPNLVNDPETYEADFADVISLKNAGFLVSNVGVLANELYDKLRGKNETIYDLVNNAPDFAALTLAAQQSGNDAEMKRVGEMRVRNNAARRLVRNLNGVWADMVEQAGLQVEA